jgi:predicted HicB family RNase H-like nuclease
VRVSESLKAKLINAARQQDRSLAWLVDKILFDWIDNADTKTPSGE